MTPRWHNSALITVLAGGWLGMSAAQADPLRPPTAPAAASASASAASAVGSAHDRRLLSCARHPSTCVQAQPAAQAPGKPR